MKRLLSLILVLIMLCGNACRAVEDGFVPNALNSFNYDAEEWCSTEVNRITFATSMIFDCLLTGSDTDLGTTEYDILVKSIAQDTMYITEDEYMVSVFCFGETHVLLFTYAPTLSRAYAETLETDIMPGFTETYMKQLYENNLFDAYYKVDAAMVTEMVRMVVDK